MTLQKWIGYELPLRRYNFSPTDRRDGQPANWVRNVPATSDRDIQRVYIHSDGSYKAYNQRNLIICHGTESFELEGCL